jgi:hypothetical protein
MLQYANNCRPGACGDMMNARAEAVLIEAADHEERMQGIARGSDARDEEDVALMNMLDHELSELTIVRLS